MASAYQKCCRELTSRLAPLGLSIPQHEVLVRLLHDDGLAQKALAQRLLVTKGSLSALVSRLEGARLVKRQGSSIDKRISCVYLTEKGRLLATQSYAVQQKLVAEIFAPFSPEALDAFAQASRQIESTFDDEELF